MKLVLKEYRRKGSMYDGRPVPSKTNHEGVREVKVLPWEEEDWDPHSPWEQGYMHGYMGGYLRAKEEAGWEVIDGAHAYREDGELVSLRWEEEEGG